MLKENRKNTSPSSLTDARFPQRSRHKSNHSQPLSPKAKSLATNHIISSNRNNNTYINMRTKSKRESCLLWHISKRTWLPVCQNEVINVGMNHMSLTHTHAKALLPTQAKALLNTKKIFCEIIVYLQQWGKDLSFTSKDVAN